MHQISRTPASSFKPRLSMIRHTQQPQPQQHPVRTTSSFRVHLQEARSYIARRRAWLLGIGCFFLAITLCGLLFTVHMYYIRDGGTGWLKRSETSGGMDSGTMAFMPLRKTEHNGLIERSPGIIPYYECGDQMKSCEAFNQPHICCPVGTHCFEAQFTPSMIVCCRSFSFSHCDYSASKPPTCISGTIQCSADTGGGCCPVGTVCSPNGCIQVLSPSTVGTLATSSSAVPGSVFPGSSSQMLPSQAGNPSTSPITKTITEAPAATVTKVKQGEVATAGVAKKVSMMYTLYLPYLAAWTLVCVAAIMGML
ncbi:hypothetical protein HYALB_00002436 [Hymenoscyphus albidus]|uniref:Uncharacterized protein n=1 Tax=Hymenoscyphus albidus TaxID=595503 RepID=A0A9N9LRL9_9HELO|nr:hypothetical protein HYALB_00002436 [Hymenoscyphus albidus]